MARYHKGTCTGITGPIYISAKLMSKCMRYLDPSDDKMKILGSAANPHFRGKKVTGEVRTEIEHNSLAGTKATSVAMVFTEASGGADLTLTFPAVVWSTHKGEMDNADTKPGRFSLTFEGQVPA